LQPFKELRLAQLHRHREHVITEAAAITFIFSLNIVSLAMFDEHVSEDTKVAMVKNCKAYPPNPLSMRQLDTSGQAV